MGLEGAPLTHYLISLKEYDEMAKITRLKTNPRLSGLVRHAGVLYLAGQVPSDLQAGVEAQTAEVLEKIDALLEEGGSDKSRLLSAQIWLKNIDRDYAAMNSVWAAWLPVDSAPARATVQADLARPEVLVEIMVIAAASEA
jgi:enamine deaminase RidA (YjgF/YER057c/UK114 family)